MCLLNRRCFKGGYENGWVIFRMGSNLQNFMVRDLFQVHQFESGVLGIIVVFWCRHYLLSLKYFVVIPLTLSRFLYGMVHVY